MARIVIEGGDGAGKKTQADLLCRQLECADRMVTMFDFPRYETSRIGQLIGEMLSGKHGDFRNASPYLAALPYTLDRVSVREDIRRASARGNVAVFNRYTPSNLAYQGAKLADPIARAQLIECIETIEYEELGIPKPTLVIYLAVSVDVSSELVKNKDARAYLGGKEKDQHEADLDFQYAVANVYRELARTRKDWRIVECVRDGRMRKQEDVHGEVWRLVRQHIDTHDIMI